MPVAGPGRLRRDPPAGLVVRLPGDLERQRRARFVPSRRTRRKVKCLTLSKTISTFRPAMPGRPL